MGWLGGRGRGMVEETGENGVIHIKIKFTCQRFTFEPGVTRSSLQMSVGVCEGEGRLTYKGERKAKNIINKIK